MDEIEHTAMPGPPRRLATVIVLAAALALSAGLFTLRAERAREALGSALEAAGPAGPTDMALRAHLIHQSFRKRASAQAWLQRQPDAVARLEALLVFNDIHTQLVVVHALAALPDGATALERIARTATFPLIVRAAAHIAAERPQ